MSYEITLVSRCFDDLEEIFDYYVTLNPRASALLYNSILDEPEILRTHPRIAQKEPYLEGLPTEYRSLVVKNIF